MKKRQNDDSGFEAPPIPPWFSTEEVRWTLRRAREMAGHPIHGKPTREDIERAAGETALLRANRIVGR